MDCCNQSRDNFTLTYNCILCKIPIMKHETVLIDHYLTEFHHYSYDLYPGKRNKDSKNRTAPGYSEPPRTGLSKIPLMTGLLFCIPCGNNTFFPKALGKTTCSTCITEIDTSTDHSTGTVLKKQLNGFNSHLPIAWHHECLPDLFSEVRQYAKERRVRISGGKKGNFSR